MSRRNSLLLILGRSLSQQLDRLRHTLDGLGRRLRDAVTHAVGETVGTVVRQTLHVALADDPIHEEESTHPVEPRYHDPPAWEEREERSSWSQPSWDAYSGWQDAERAEDLTYPEDEAVPESKGRQGAAMRLLVVGCQAAAWWLRRHSTCCPLLAALGVGMACGLAAYLGGPVVIAGVGLAGGAFGLVTLADAVRSGARALAGCNAFDWQLKNPSLFFSLARTQAPTRVPCVGPGQSVKCGKGEREVRWNHWFCYVQSRDEEFIMSTTTNTPNGRVTRKSLAEQIDRLDTILDGLADGLNEAVVTAVKEAVEVAVREAVQAVLTEILTNPALHEVMRHAFSPQAATIAQPVTEDRGPTLRERARRARIWIGARLQGLLQKCHAVKRRVHGHRSAAWARLQIVRQFKGPLLIALGVGVTAGVVTYFAGPWLSALVSGLGGFATTLAVQAGLWLRRMLGAMPRIDA